MIGSNDLEFSFSGLKTAVMLLARSQPADPQTHADIARAFQDAVVEVLVAKCISALQKTNLSRLVVAGGVGANKQLRAGLDAAAQRQAFEVFYPEFELCTDNGAMIAFAAALRWKDGLPAANTTFSVRPRWDLAAIG